MTNQIPSQSTEQTATGMQYPRSFANRDAINNAATYIRGQLGLASGQTFNDFGKMMRVYCRAHGSELLQIPAGIIRNGLITNPDGTPQDFSGAYSCYIELDGGLDGLEGLIDYRTGLPIQHQAFIQVFSPIKESNYLNGLVQQGMVSNVVVRPNLNSSVVRYELMDPNSTVCRQFMQRGSVEDLRALPCILPVESKGSDVTFEDARDAKRSISRDRNGTNAYSALSDSGATQKATGFIGGLVKLANQFGS